MVNISGCHPEGRGFKSRCGRQMIKFTNQVHELTLRIVLEEEVGYNGDPDNYHFWMALTDEEVPTDHGYFPEPGLCLLLRRDTWYGICRLPEEERNRQKQLLIMRGIRKLRHYEASRIREINGERIVIGVA